MDIVISAGSQEPIYSQIYSQISSQIINGSITGGTRLPTIRNVAQELRISVIPVKRAWEELDRNGLIKTIPGKGTFAAELNGNAISEIKNRKAETLVLQMCRQAKESGISADELVSLIRKFY